MESTIITLLASAVGALVIAIMIIVTVYKHQLQKAQKRCEELQRQNKTLRNNYNAMYDYCDELLQKCEKQKTKAQIADAVIESRKK